MDNVVITHAVRTPIGAYLGTLKNYSAPDLGVFAVKGLIQRSGVDPKLITELFFGHGRQASSGPNPARQITVRSGIPETSPAWTINQACASGLRAIVAAAQSIQLGENEVAIAGGVESMSNMPFMIPNMREGLRLGHAKLVDAMYKDGFECPLSNKLMGETAETLAKKHNISRTEQDEFAVSSQSKCEAARKAGRFNDEISPVEMTDRKGSKTSFATDEHARDGVKLESLAKLPPVFDKAGTVTAANSSGITDGAAALLLMKESKAKALGFAPLATFEHWAQVGVDPAIMGIGPVPALQKLEKKTGRNVGGYDLIELNEAFAAQVLACDREMKLPMERLNVNGGAIALGHPIGCTGARIVVTLLHEMKRRGSKAGVATLCVSGGMGMAVSFTR
ncbi:MAG: acetyl-CoA C-acetyltransferase [Planctomycetes bacterium]|nr:acetyl-CoA C-acetyltransferase [Planctomycetota bacterium]NUQ33862.1 acetyl-CoA C-acetyltransferase [Planctomycetaceae bacterium]